MQDLINAVAARLGVSTATATTAIGSLLALIDRTADKPLVAELFAKLPRARTLASDADHETGEEALASESLLRTLAGRAGPGVHADALMPLAASGLGAGQIATATAMFLDWTSRMAGPELTARLTATVPALRNLAQPAALVA